MTTQLAVPKKTEPSSELVSLIKDAAESIISFGEIWKQVKSKGKEEGFSEDELRGELRKSVKARLPDLTPRQLKDKIFHLTHQEARNEDNKQRRKLQKVYPIRNW